MNKTKKDPKMTTATTNLVPRPRAVSIMDRKSSMGKPLSKDKIEGFTNIGLGLQGGGGGGSGSVGSATSKSGSYCGQEFFLMNNVKSLERAVDFLVEEASNICRGGKDIGADVIPPLRDVLFQQSFANAANAASKEEKEPTTTVTKKKKKKAAQSYASFKSKPPSSSTSSLTHPFLMDNFREQYAKVEAIARPPSSASSLPAFTATPGARMSSTSSLPNYTSGAITKKDDSDDDEEDEDTSLLPFMKELYKVRFGPRRWDSDILQHLLNTAILVGDKPLVFWLLEIMDETFKDDNSTKTKQKVQRHAMCTASYFGRIPIIEQLIVQPYNCPVDGSNYYTDGKTPIFYAAYGNQVETIKYFIQTHGVRVGTGGDGASGGSGGTKGNTTTTTTTPAKGDKGKETTPGTKPVKTPETTTKKKKDKTTTTTTPSTTKKKKKKISKNGDKAKKEDDDDDATAATVGSSSSFEVPPLPLVPGDVPLVPTGGATSAGDDNHHHHTPPTNPNEHIWDLNSYYTRLSGYVEAVIQQQDLQRLERLIEKFPAVMEDAMIQALRVKNSPMVELILTKGYPLEIPLTPAYDTALLLAVQQEDIASARLLLEKGADVNCSDKDGFRCIHVAAEKSNTEMTRLLLDEYDANVDGVHTAEGATPLMLHLSGPKGPSLEYVRLLVRNGVEIDESRSPIFTPLHDVAYAGHTRIADYLLQQGVLLERRSYEGFTALMYACEQGHYETAKLLIEKYGANINAQHPSGRSTLTHTCIHEHTEVVRLLLEHRVDFEDSDKTFLEAVPKFKNNRTIINMLKEYKGINSSNNNKGSKKNPEKQ